MDLIGPLELAGLRDLAEQAMPDLCTITRPGERGAYDRETNTHAPSTDTEVWSGRCRVARGGLAAVDADTGGLAETLGRYTVHLPHDVDPVEIGDVVTVDESTDPLLIGQFLTVTSVPPSSIHAQRSVEVEDPQIRVDGS